MIESCGFYEKYYIVLVVTYIWENVIAGSFEASLAKNYGKVQIPKIIKRILFPFFYVKRFSCFALLYQIFNFIVFVFMVLLGIFSDKEVTVYAYKIFIGYQKFYWLAGPLALSFTRWCGEMRLNLKGFKDNKNDTDTVSYILKSMGAQSLQSDCNTVLFVKSSFVSKAYVFLIYVGRNYTIPEIDYRDILSSLLNEGCTLIYLSSETFEDEETYILMLKKTLHLVEEKCGSQNVPVFFIGRALFEIPVMTLLIAQWKSVSGMIWLGITTKKETIKILNKDFTDEAKRILEERKSDICLINIYDKHHMDYLYTWLSAKIMYVFLEENKVQ